MWNKPSKLNNTPTIDVSKTAEKPEQLGDKFISQAEQLMGVATVKDQQGSIITVPSSQDTTQGFVDFFLSSNVKPTFTDSIENDRMTMYDTYDQMDLYVSQCQITLDTYTDESLGTGFVDIPFTVWSSDPHCEAYINKILKKNHFTEHLSSYVRSLFKYGDCGFLFHMPAGAVNYDPDDLHMEFVRAKDMKIFSQGDVEYQYELGSVNKPVSELLTSMVESDARNKITSEELSATVTGQKQKRPRATAWDFCHWSIYNADYAPYGRSLLDRMRTLADQKATMEVLMALGRASRIERLILEVVAPSNTPTVAMSQVQRTANTFKNMIMGADGGAGRNRNNNMGLTDVLTIPKGIVEIKKLNSSFDVSGTQDVEYFRDELITLSRIQKSSFLADQSINRGSTLESQDLRFARALVPYARAYEEGLYKLCVQIALLGGFDLTRTAIEVTTNRPAYVTKEYLQTYEQLCNSAANLLSKAGVTPDNPEYNKKYTKMLRKLGMPEDYLRLMTTKQVTNPDAVSISPTSTSGDVGIQNTPTDNATSSEDSMSESVYTLHPDWMSFKEATNLIVRNQEMLKESKAKSTKESNNEHKVTKVSHRSTRKNKV